MTARGADNHEPARLTAIPAEAMVYARRPNERGLYMRPYTQLPVMSGEHPDVDRTAPTITSRQGSQRHQQRHQQLKRWSTPLD